MAIPLKFLLFERRVVICLDMKKIKIQVTQILEVPDDTEIIQGNGDSMFKIGDTYFLPSLEFMQSNLKGAEKMNFIEMDEDTCDLIYSYMVLEKSEITNE